MTKRINWLPNERVDVPDMKAGTNDLSTGIVQQHVERLIIDHFTRVSNGFRVEIANQISFPGQFTVYNGVAFDRDGEILQNTDEENTSRSITLSADGQYFVEVLFRTDESNTDARGFWDPTVDNGTDPSGDVRLPGHEFSQNVATRISPDWQIVTPVSTTGFAISTLPNSLKVPVAVIQVAGGVIVGGTTVPAQTVLETDTGIGATVIKGLDTRLFPDVFAANLGVTAISVTSNDRRNGILTLAIGLVATHQAGERIVQTGVGINQFLTDRDDPALPATTTKDGRPRLFQGFEDRGKALSTNPASTTPPGDVSDTTIQGLKDYVDFIAAQMRELKFGAARSSDVGKVSPPTVFANPPRYYHHSGGLQGSRTATFTIGDGITSWGDFNVLQMGTINAALTAALAALPAGGGSIHIKGSTSPYVFGAGAVAVTKSLILSGDGPSTQLVAGANPVMALGATACEIHDLQILRSGAAAVSLTSSTGSIIIRDCLIEGADLSVDSNGLFENVVFNASAGGGTNAVGLTGTKLINCVFNHCTFSSSENVAGARGLLIPGPNASNISIRDCVFSIPALSVAAAELATVNAVDNICFDHCDFSGGGSGTNMIEMLAATLSTHIVIRDCTSTGSTFLNADKVSDVQIHGCKIYTNFVDTKAISFGADVANAYITVSDCSIEHLAAAGATGTGIIVGNANNLHLRNFIAIDIDRMIVVLDGFDIDINDCDHFCPTAGRGHLGINLPATSRNVRISGCKISQLRNTANGFINGIEVDGTHTNLSIDNCELDTLGGAAAAVPVRGIVFVPAAAGSCVDIEITDCNFLTLDAGAAQLVHGIRFTDEVDRLSITGCKMHNIGFDATTTTVGIYLSGGMDISVSNNVIQNIGNAAVVNHAIFVDPSPTAGNHGINVIVSGNIIGNVASVAAGSVNGEIQFHNAGVRVFVINNVFEIQNVNSVAIQFWHDAADPNQMKDITVSGNIIGSTNSNSCENGIEFSLSSPTDERIVVANNTVRGFVYTGISLISTANARNIVVSNNNLYTDNAVPTGIFMAQITIFAVTGNVVDLPDLVANGKIGILLIACFDGSVSANHTAIGDSTAGHIDVIGGVRINFTSNCMRFPAGTATGYGIKIGGGATQTFGAANLVANVTGAGRDYSGIVHTNSRQDGAGPPNNAANPTAFTDIGLNISY